MVTQPGFCWTVPSQPLPGEEPALAGWPSPLRFILDVRRRREAWQVESSPPSHDCRRH